MSIPSDQHIPVMLPEVLHYLAPEAGKTYVDGTFGFGGYSRGILTTSDCTLFAIDRDPEALPRAQAVSNDHPERFTLLQGCFGEMEILLADKKIEKVDGIVLDIGVSSMQIDDAERGFSFREDGPLDMRMSQTGKSAAEVVNTYGEKELADIIYKYGEERASRAVARAIVKFRSEETISRTVQLANIVRSVVRSSKKDKIDPATRTFQGLRIYVNDELGELERALVAAERILVSGGRLVIVSFHSLEDRIVKSFLKSRSGGNPRPSRYAPDFDIEGPSPSFSLLSRKAIGPSEEETRINPRARSARLRAAERTNAPAWSEKEAA
jgi:16S rRNA (cytosine1402-N4)-methyltransferase